MRSRQQSLLSSAREAKGWTQRALAENAGVSQSTISKAEAGLVPLSSEACKSVAHVLEVAPELIAASATCSVSVNPIHHRRRASTMSATVMRRIVGTTLLTQYSVDQLTSGIDLVSEVKLPTIPIDICPPEQAAQQVRDEWRIPDGPVRHVTALLEAAGVIVVVRDLHAAGQDALSSRGSAVGPSSPLVVVSSGIPADRLRFTLTHELGHLVMHSVPTDDQEQQANAFASEFLMPASVIAEELVGLASTDFDRLFRLKARWGVSIAALMRRAHDLGEVSDRQYRAFHVNLNRLGWRLIEPNQPDREIPTTMRRLIDLRLESGESIDQLANRAGMLVPQFLKVYRPDLAQPAARTLRLGGDLS